MNNEAPFLGNLSDRFESGDDRLVYVVAMRTSAIHHS
jgi:hypothetical protein